MVSKMRVSHSARPHAVRAVMSHNVNCAQRRSRRVSEPRAAATGGGVAAEPRMEGAVQGVKG